MSFYRLLRPLISRLSAETAHELATAALRWRMVPSQRAVDDPFTWGGVTFLNRIGIAAGFDKNAEYLGGLSDLRVGFVEIGTILVSPWAGQSLQPRMTRLMSERGLWNRLGFPSHGVAEVQRRLALFASTPARARLRIACNIGPHPGNLKAATDIDGYLRVVRDELLALARELHRFADLLVVNLTSPNTPGLRDALQHAELIQRVLAPLRHSCRALDLHRTQRAGVAVSSAACPLLIKLPPEDAAEQPWTEAALRALLTPLLEADVCDGFVATNTSIAWSRRLAPHALPDAPGGVSGQPLRDSALRTVRMVRSSAGPRALLIGCGGVMRPDDAVQMIEAGANLVETYTGMVYEGPGFPAACAAAMQQAGRAAEALHRRGAEDAEIGAFEPRYAY